MMNISRSGHCKEIMVKTLPVNYTSSRFRSDQKHRSDIIGILST
jgi:hypothetical protein